MDVNIEYADLVSEMQQDRIVIEYLRDKATAREFYRAFCNMQWRKRNFITPEDKVIVRLKGEGDPSIWTASWRRAGEIIADLRNLHYNANEDYLDFYCSGFEGEVTDLVEECFNRMGWEPVPYDW